MMRVKYELGPGAMEIVQETSEIFIESLQNLRAAKRKRMWMISETRVKLEKAMMLLYNPRLRPFLMLMPVRLA
jgi:hypothetical protein